MKIIEQSFTIAGFATWKLCKLMAVGVIVSYALTFISRLEMAHPLDVLIGLSSVLAVFYILMVIAGLFFFSEKG